MKALVGVCVACLALLWSSVAAAGNLTSTLSALVGEGGGGGDL